MTSLRNFLLVVFVTMVTVVTLTSLKQPIWLCGSDFFRSPWSVATLVDAYAGFLLFYAWVFYKERGVAAKVVWFLLIMGLGNIATSAYALLQLRSLPRGAGIERLLLRDADGRPA